MRAWLEIDMDNLKYNLNKIKELVHGTNVLGVIKANSYGFGAIEIAKELSKFGIEIFGVASLEEAMELREGGIEEEILILGSLFNDEIEIAAEKNFQITVSSMRQIEFLESNKIDAEMHIKIDTGMGRLGFTPSEGRKAVDYCINRGLKVVGIYSHLSDADGMNDEAYNYTKEQINKFKIFEEYKTIKYIHILNSGGILRFNDGFKGNLVRAGICMYGMLGNERVPGFKRVFTMKTRILFIRTLEEDSYISYGRTIKLKKGETFATLAIGYADGMKKEFSNKTYALIEGEKCPIVGEICMDMCMVKIPESILKKINIGTEAIVIRDDIIEEINSIHKSTWDILTGIGRRVYRVYKKNGTPYLITR
ncbi:alanine racemase [Fusobacterium varium]|uniref:alanine racemase n=1 Tax=Fusobacterium varium TaxID=856 RepID=UPI00241F997A|nr:alanine racemase [Fusobacterium varium]